MSVGTRLREERQRLGLSQERLAGVAGVAKNTAINWEKDASSPTVAALIALAEAGVDSIYILTGKRTIDPSVSDDEHATLVIDDVESDLIDPSHLRKPEESIQEAEARAISQAIELLRRVLSWNSPSDLSQSVIDRATTLLEFAENPSKLHELRAAAFAQKHRERLITKEGLAIWLKRWPYQPSEAVINQLASISIDYSVPYEPLVELLHEIYTDIRARFPRS